MSSPVLGAGTMRPMMSPTSILNGRMRVRLGRGVLLVIVLWFGSFSGSLQAQLSLTSTARIGVLDGKDEISLGVIRDIAADRRGNFAVLDAGTQSVKVFTSSGVPIQVLGRPGRGPGEFFVPVALTVDRDDNLYVLDTGNQKVEVYTPADQGFRHRGSFRIDFPAYDICAMGDELFMHGYRNERVLHAFTRSGQLTRSFGGSLYADHPYLRVASSRGVLQCVEDERTLLLLPLLSPEIRAFHADGRSRWTARIPEYEPVVIRKTARGAVYRTGRSGRHHMASSIVPLGAEHVIVQIGFIGRTEVAKPEEFNRVNSFAVNVKTGGIRPMSAVTPRLLELRDGIGHSPRAEPFPQIVLYRAAYPVERSR